MTSLLIMHRLFGAVIVIGPNIGYILGADRVSRLALY